LILASRGLWIVSDWSSRKVFPSHGNVDVIVVMIIMLLLGGYFLTARMQRSATAPIGSEVAARRSLSEEQKLAGLWALRRFGAGHNYMIGWSKIVYYLDGIWTALPIAPLPGILSYARKHGAEFLVLETSDAGIDERALAQIIPNATLAGVYRSTELPYIAVFYRFRK
jgi:hypothetical protein